MYRNITNFEFLNLINKVDVIIEKQEGTVRAIENILKNSINKELKLVVNKLVNEYINYSYDAYTKKTTIQCIIPKTISKKLISKSNQITKANNIRSDKEYYDQFKNL